MNNDKTSSLEEEFKAVVEKFLNYLGTQRLLIPTVKVNVEPSPDDPNAILITITGPGICNENDTDKPVC